MNETSITEIRLPDAYVAVDLETTGLDARQDKIIEIGAVLVKHGVETASFQTLVNPHRQLSEKTKELTHLTDEMLSGAPELEPALLEFLEFSCIEGEPLPILGHQVMFDYSFLKRAAVNLGQSFERNGMDTLKLCRRFLPPEEKKNLEAACAWFALPRETAHRALSDARDAHRLFERLKEQFGEQDPLAFFPQPLICKVKREQPATKNQKERLRYLLKYHKIDLPVQIDYLSRNEISRITDKIISQYGRINTGRHS